MPTFTRSELTLNDAFREIEQQTGYRISFSYKDIDPSQRVEVPAGYPIPITDAMRRLLAHTGCAYIIYEQNILIFNENNRPKGIPTQTQTAQRGDHSADNALVKKQAEPSPPFTMTYPAVTLSLDNRQAGRRRNVADMLPHYRHHFPLLYLKTDLLYGAAALTPNLSLEIGLSPRATLDLTVGYNPWKRRTDDPENRKFVHLLTKAEYRYWLCERFSGHFLGMHALYASFNVSNRDHLGWMGFDTGNRYQGYGAGAGLSYGYLWHWSERWGMEFNVGAGAVWRKYERFDCVKCGDKLEDKQDVYLGPTAVGIKLVYRLK
jgi:hypothetical protein